MGDNKLIELRRQAEGAVFDMAEGDLKVKAFEVVLNHLLSKTGEASKAQPVKNDEVSEPKASKRVNVTGKTQRIVALKNEDYFRELRTIGQVREELAARGWHYPLTALSGPLQELVQRRELRRQKLSEGKKKVWKYSNP